MCKKIIDAVFTCILTSFLFASAYWIAPYKIVNQIRYLPHSAFGQQTIYDFNEALYQWNAATGRGLMSREPYARHSSIDYPRRDHINKIYRVATDCDDYVAANTIYYSSGVVLESDINFNMCHKFANGAVSDHYDVFSVFLHESGHTVGLEHSQYGIAVMWYEAPLGCTKRGLTFDERNGLARIY